MSSPNKTTIDSNRECIVRLPGLRKCDHQTSAKRGKARKGNRKNKGNHYAFNRHPFESLRIQKIESEIPNESDHSGSLKELSENCSSKIEKTNDRNSDLN
jgi:hypothetical protein